MAEIIKGTDKKLVNQMQAARSILCYNLKKGVATKDDIQEFINKYCNDDKLWKNIDIFIPSKSIGCLLNAAGMSSNHSLSAITNDVVLKYFLQTWTTGDMSAEKYFYIILNFAPYEGLEPILQYYKQKLYPDQIEKYNQTVNNLFSYFIGSVFSKRESTTLPLPDIDKFDTCCNAFLEEGAVLESYWLSRIISEKYPINLEAMKKLLHSKYFSFDSYDNNDKYYILNCLFNTGNTNDENIKFPTEILELLLETGINPDVIKHVQQSYNNENCTLLWRLCYGYYNSNIPGTYMAEIIDILLKHGANPNFRDTITNLSIIEVARRNNNKYVSEVFSKLTGIQLVEDVRSEDKSLILAVSRRSLANVNKALKNGANPNIYRAPNKDKIPVICTAVGNLDVEITQSLLSAGVNINAQTTKRIGINEYLLMGLATIFNNTSIDEELTNKISYNEQNEWFCIKTDEEKEIAVKNIEKQMPRFQQMLCCLKAGGWNVPDMLIQEMIYYLAKFVNNTEPLTLTEQKIYNAISKNIEFLVSLGGNIDSLFMPNVRCWDSLRNQRYNKTDYNNAHTILAEACIYKHVPTVKMLTDLGADVTKGVKQNNEYGPSIPIVCAGYIDELTTSSLSYKEQDIINEEIWRIKKVIQILIDKGASIYQEEPNGLTYKKLFENKSSSSNKILFGHYFSKEDYWNKHEDLKEEIKNYPIKYINEKTASLSEKSYIAKFDYSI